MTTPLQQAGAVADPSNYASIHVNRMFTGLWTQRNPLRDAATPYLYEKFYAGARYDSLLDGLNEEVTSRLTLARRPGHSVYNPMILGPVNRFYSFREFQNGGQTIRVIADTAAEVWEVTNGQQTGVFGKSPGAGSSYFQSVGGRLYFGNGVEIKKWAPSITAGAYNMGIAAPSAAPNVANVDQLASAFPSWAANTFYAPHLQIVDSNGNVQLLTTGGALGGSAPTWATSAGTTTADGSAVWTCKGSASRANSHAYSAGDVIVVTYTKTVQVPGPPYQYSPGGVQQPTYHSQTYTFTDQFVCVTAGTSAGSSPAFSAGNGLGGQVQDGGVVWQNAGAQLVWATLGAGCLVSTASTILDSANNLQTVTRAGKSGGTAPTWLPKQNDVTVDGTAAWTNSGPYNVDASNTGSVRYGYAFKSSLFGSVSTLSPTVAIAPTTTGYVAVQGAGSTDTQVDKIQIFRTAQRGETLLLLDEIDAPASGSTWSYADAKPDAALNTLLQAPINGNNNPPPAGLINLTYHLNRIFGSQGTTVYWSRTADQTPGAPAECFRPTDFQEFPSTVTRLWPCSLGLVVFTVSDIYLILGQANDNSPLYAVRFLEKIGLKSYDAFAINGSTAYLQTQDGRIVSLDPGAGVLEVGFPIGDQLKTVTVNPNLVPGTRFAPTIASLPAGWLAVDSGPSVAHVGSLSGYGDGTTALHMHVTAQTGSDDVIITTGVRQLSLLGLTVHDYVGISLDCVGLSVTQPGDTEFINIILGHGVPPTLIEYEQIPLSNPTLAGATGSYIKSVTVNGTRLNIVMSLPANCDTIELQHRGVRVLNSDMTSAHWKIEKLPATTAAACTPWNDGIPFNASQTWMTWHQDGSGDTALYVGDGATGWFRMTATAPPESGLAWSPRAAVVGGCSAVQSVEVSPGIYRLLLGPPGLTAYTNNAPILQRDRSVNTDNGELFNHYAVIGSIVLAKPGSTAEISFITLDSLRVGQRPTVGILLDEISGPFDALHFNCPDPPLLPHSNTLYNDRYYCQQSQEPTYCRHLQLRFDWPAQDCYEELLGYAIFGGEYQETKNQ